MRKSLLLIIALSSTTIQAEDRLDLQEFHGRAALLTATTDYIIMSCTQPEEAKCDGQCAEVWCDSNNDEDCALASRPVVRVADQCATCERGDLFLSRNMFHQLPGTNTDTHLFSVGWRCVDCGMNVGSQHGSNTITVGELMRPRTRSHVQATLTFDNITDQVAHQPIQDGALRCPMSDQHTAGSFDTQVEILLVDSDIRRKGKDVSENSSDFTLSSGLGSTAEDAKRGDVKREKSKFSLMSSLSSSSSKSANDDLSPPPQVSLRIIPSSGSSIYDEESLSSGSGSLLSLSTANQDSSYFEETIFLDNSQYARAISTSSSLSGTTPDKNQLPTSTTVSPDDSVDKSLSATSSVTKSPFFYAAIMLGIVGLMGTTIGHRAKQKRSYRDEQRAFRMFSQAGTHVCNRRLAPSSLAVLASRTRPDSHSIAIL